MRGMGNIPCPRNIVRTYHCPQPVNHGSYITLVGSSFIWQNMHMWNVKHLSSLDHSSRQTTSSSWLTTNHLIRLFRERSFDGISNPQLFALNALSCGTWYTMCARWWQSFLWCHISPHLTVIYSGNKDNASNHLAVYKPTIYMIRAIHGYG